MTSDAIEKILFESAQAYFESKSKAGEYTLGGKVYYMGARQFQSTQSSYPEDAVVGFLTGVGTDVVEGTCLLNVYVPDVEGVSGIRYRDIKRCREVSDVLKKFAAFANQWQGMIFFYRKDVIATQGEPSINQHFVSLKLNFKVLDPDYYN